MTTRRTFVAQELANFFHSKEIDAVSGLLMPMKLYSAFKDAPYKNIYVRRLFGSWSRAMSIVQPHLSKLTEPVVTEPVVTEPVQELEDPLAALRKA